MIWEYVLVIIAGTPLFFLEDSTFFHCLPSLKADNDFATGTPCGAELLT